jgi:hypothetical protein
MLYGGMIMSKLVIVDTVSSCVEHIINDENDFRALLYSLVDSGTRIVIIEISGIGIVTLGVGLLYGFIQFSKNGEPPYLVALANSLDELHDMDNEMEFDAGGTPTMIPIRFCMYYAQIVDIIAYIFRNEKLPPNINWEEV